MNQALDLTKRKPMPKAWPGGFGGGGPSWQSQVLARGWGYAIILRSSLRISCMGMSKCRG